MTQETIASNFSSATFDGVIDDMSCDQPYFKVWLMVQTFLSLGDQLNF